MGKMSQVGLKTPVGLRTPSPSNAPRGGAILQNMWSIDSEESSESLESSTSNPRIGRMGSNPQSPIFGSIPRSRSSSPPPPPRHPPKSPPGRSQPPPPPGRSPSRQNSQPAPPPNKPGTLGGHNIGRMSPSTKSGLASHMAKGIAKPGLARAGSEPVTFADGLPMAQLVFLDNEKRAQLVFLDNEKRASLLALSSGRRGSGSSACAGSPIKNAHPTPKGKRGSGRAAFQPHRAQSTPPDGRYESDLHSCSTRDSSDSSPESYRVTDKKFSFGVSPRAEVEEKELDEKDKELLQHQHPLGKTWALWEKEEGLAEEDDDDETTSQSDSNTEPSELSSSTTEATQADDEASKSIRYMKNCNTIKTFSSIEDFMPLYNGVPLPSALLKKHQIIRKNIQEESWSRSTSVPNSSPEHRGKKVSTLDAVMFFEDGVKPSWEDPEHQKGGSLHFTFKTDFPGAAADELWERLLFSTLGQQLPHVELITGIRLCDRLPKNAKWMKKPITAVRLEVWYRVMDRDQQYELRKAIMALFHETLACGGCVKRSKYNWKTHNQKFKCQLNYAAPTFKSTSFESKQSVSVAC